MSESLAKCKGGVYRAKQVPGGPGTALQYRKVMTNKRIHVSAIVLFIAAIIIDMHNNGLCPWCPWFSPGSPHPSAFLCRRTCASNQNYRIVYGTWQRVAGSGYCLCLDPKTTLRRLSQVLALPGRVCVRSGRVGSGRVASLSLSVCVCRCLSITRCAMKSLLRIK